jgi:hypothetical protein
MVVSVCGYARSTQRNLGVIARLGRAIQYAAAAVTNREASGILDSPLSRE